MNVKGVAEVIPMGLIKGYNPKQTIENVELRATLEKAVEDAKLNVTERMALNKKFFPNGGGFNLFPDNIEIPHFNIFYKPGQSDIDSFTKEVFSVKIPENICRRKSHILKSSKGNFQANFDNALKKLKKVLDGNI